MLFAIHAIDKPDSLHVRTETRPAHLEFMAGFEIPVGGPLLDGDGEMCGSLIVLEADSWAEAQSFIEGDPYGHAGLFDRVTLRQLRPAAWPNPGSA